jgi:hypothetical protein
MPDDQKPMPTMRQMRIAQMKLELARLEHEEAEGKPTPKEIARELLNDPDTQKRFGF